MNKNTIVSMNVTRKENDKRKLKEQQKKEMELRQVEHVSNSYRNAQSAFNDTHVVDALKKVQESDTTVDVGFARFSGTSLYTESLGKSLDKSLDKLQKDTMDRIKRIFPTYVKDDELDKPKEMDSTVKNKTASTDSIKEDITWDLICSQIGKERRKHNRLFEHTSRWGVNVSKQH